MEGLAPVRDRAHELLDDPAELDRLLESGARRAHEVALPTLEERPGQARPRLAGCNGLRSTLDRIDRKGYGAYKDLSGSHDFGSFTLFVDRVQRDPFAPPSLIRIRTKENPFDPALFENPVRRVAFEDFLTRSVEKDHPARRAR